MTRTLKSCVGILFVYLIIAGGLAATKEPLSNWKSATTRPIASELGQRFLDTNNQLLGTLAAGLFKLVFDRFGASDSRPEEDRTVDPLIPDRSVQIVEGITYRGVFVPRARILKVLDLAEQKLKLSGASGEELQRRSAELQAEVESAMLRLARLESIRWTLLTCAIYSILTPLSVMCEYWIRSQLLVGSYENVVYRYGSTFALMLASAGLGFYSFSRFRSSSSGRGMRAAMMVAGAGTILPGLILVTFLFTPALYEAATLDKYRCAIGDWKIPLFGFICVTRLCLCPVAAICGSLIAEMRK